MSIDCRWGPLANGPAGVIVRRRRRTGPRRIVASAATDVKKLKSTAADPLVRLPMGHTLLAAACVAFAGCATTPIGRVVPSDFDHDRIFVVAPADDGEALRFYTDSGGGPNVIRRSVATRLGLPTIGMLPVEGDDAVPRPLVPFPDAMRRAGVPPPEVDDDFKGGMWSQEDDRYPFYADGFVGSRWYRDRIWEIDYPNRSVKLLGRATPLDPSHRLVLGFQSDAAGKRTTDFARLAMTVDGESMGMLFDTGANAGLTDAAAMAFGVPRGTRIATSFITKSMFDRWTTRHPDWRVLQDADAIGDSTMPMIEVPKVTIAGLVVGPVWFARRPDNAFHAYMASMMDEPVEGALGGSAFHDLRVTIDYPAAVAYFEIPAPVR